MVEQGTHKPLVGSSTLPPGTITRMAWGLHSSWLRWPALHWIVRRLGCTHRAAFPRSHSYNKAFGRETRDCGEKGSIDTPRCTANRATAETEEKSATSALSSATVEQPRKLSGLVGSSTLPLALPYSLGCERYGCKSLSAPRTAAMKQTPLRSITAPVQPS